MILRVSGCGVPLLVEDGDLRFAMLSALGRRWLLAYNIVRSGFRFVRRSAVLFRMRIALLKKV